MLLWTGVKCPPKRGRFFFELAEEKIILAAILEMKDLKAVKESTGRN